MGTIRQPTTTTAGSADEFLFTRKRQQSLSVMQLISGREELELGNFFHAGIYT